MSSQKGLHPADSPKLAASPGRSLLCVCMAADSVFRWRVRKRLEWFISFYRMTVRVTGSLESQTYCWGEFVFAQLVTRPDDPRLWFYEQCLPM